MPITLETLFSPTAETTFEFLGESVTVVWAPFRWTGAMQDKANALAEEAEGDEAAIATARAAGNTAAATALQQAMDLKERDATRAFLADLLVSWDVLDDGKPIPTDYETLNKLPDPFLKMVFLSLASENQPDPQKAPSSDEPSSTDPSTGSAPSPTGSSSSAQPEPSASAPLSSTSEPSDPAGTPPGATGPTKPRAPSRLRPSG